VPAFMTVVESVDRPSPSWSMPAPSVCTISARIQRFLNPQASIGESTHHSLLPIVLLVDSPTHVLVRAPRGYQDRLLVLSGPFDRKDVVKRLSSHLESRFELTSGMVSRGETRRTTATRWSATYIGLEEIIELLFEIDHRGWLQVGCVKCWVSCADGSSCKLGRMFRT
jgi:hypothetical protein